jgi:hypothetical protein
MRGFPAEADLVAVAARAVRALASAAAMLR